MVKNRIASLAIITLGLVLCGVGVYLVKDYADFHAASMPAIATVRSVERAVNPEESDLYVDYYVDSVRYSAKLDFFGLPPMPGEQLTIYYNPYETTEARSLENVEYWIFVILTAGLAITAVGLLFHKKQECHYTVIDDIVIEVEATVTDYHEERTTADNGPTKYTLHCTGPDIKGKFVEYIYEGYKGNPEDLVGTAVQVKVNTLDPTHYIVELGDDKSV